MGQENKPDGVRALTGRDASSSELIQVKASNETMK
jgi:hypothetical protein